MVRATVDHATWGVWPSVRLSTAAAELEVVSEVGARVVSLRDRVRDREWLAQGEPPAELTQMAWADEGAAFSGRESFGWDECLPTTAVCPDPLAPDGPRLRDHGDQWGRGAYLAPRDGLTRDRRFRGHVNHVNMPALVEVGEPCHQRPV